MNSTTLRSEPRGDAAALGLDTPAAGSTLDGIPGGRPFSLAWDALRAGAIHALRWAAAVALYRSGALALYARWRRRRLHGGELRILRYHRVIPDSEPEAVYPLGVRAGSFAAQMRFLARRYRTIDVRTAGRFLEAESGGPGLRVLVTLDDGYRDNLTEGLPILQAHRIPAVVFVATGAVSSGNRFPWERLKRVVESAGRRSLRLPGGGAIVLGGVRSRRVAFRRLHRWLEGLPPGEREAVLRLWESSSEPDPRNDGPLSWEEVRALAAGGVDIGSHTVRHLRLSSLSEGEIREELERSRARLEEVLGRPVDTLAFPSGDYDARVLRAARDAGYRLAFTTRPGSNVPGARPLELRRKGIGGRTAETPWGSFSPSLFAAEVEGVYDHALRRVFP